MDSIIQDKKECLICGAVDNLNSHHVFYGTANRAVSEKYGLKVWLCVKHHTNGADAVHFNRKIDMAIKAMAQQKFEETHSREEFVKEFGKSWL